MELLVDRAISNEDATLSLIYIDDDFECFGLEDEYREDKVPGETRIPQGVYRVGLRRIGGFHNRYLKKFSFHVGMLQIMDVPGFEYILIHVGNTDDNTAGCLLVGGGANAIDELTVASSVLAYKRLYSRVIQSAIKGDLTIRFVNSDRNLRS